MSVAARLSGRPPSPLVRARTVAPLAAVSGSGTAHRTATAKSHALGGSDGSALCRPAPNLSSLPGHSKVSPRPIGRRLSPPRWPLDVFEPHDINPGPPTTPSITAQHLEVVFQASPLIFVEVFGTRHVSQFRQQGGEPFLQVTPVPKSSSRSHEIDRPAWEWARFVQEAARTAQSS